MKRLVPLAVAAVVLAPAGTAAPPTITAAATPAAGIAPLRVTLTASGDAASYHWELGDGAVADGAAVTHVYPAGRFTALVTATSASGETAQATVVVVAAQRTLSLAAPRTAEYAARTVLRGRLAPATAGVPVRIYRGSTYVTSTRTTGGGRFAAAIRLTTPGRYHARYGAARSAALAIRVVPRLRVLLPPTAALGEPLAVRILLEPPRSARLRLVVTRDGRRLGSRSLTRGGSVRLPTGVAGRLVVGVRARPRPGFVAVRRTARSLVVVPQLALGARGESVRELERRLADQRYALRGVDGVFAEDTLEAVYAFQGVHGLARTGRVDAALWRLIGRSASPSARFLGDHIEVDKARQVLLDVRAGIVVRVVHVSTGASGNTPVGIWHVYRKVPGFDWVLYYPMYFLRGFAIHGYPSVPPYPASHGCVRVPMWIAPTLYASHPYGTTIVVYA